MKIGFNSRPPSRRSQEATTKQRLFDQRSSPSSAKCFAEDQVHDDGGFLTSSFYIVVKSSLQYLFYLHYIIIKPSSMLLSAAVNSWWACRRNQQISNLDNLPLSRSHAAAIFINDFLICHLLIAPPLSLKLWHHLCTAPCSINLNCTKYNEYVGNIRYGGT